MPFVRKANGPIAERGYSDGSPQRGTEASLIDDLLDVARITGGRYSYIAAFRRSALFRDALADG